MYRFGNLKRACVLTCLVFICRIATSQSASLKIEDALGTLAFAGRMPIALSPDGEWVAYTVEDDRKRESAQDERYRFYTRTGVFLEAVGCDVWLANTKTYESRNLTGGKGSSSSPVWSPDGKYLAFYSDRSGTERIWLWERATGQMRQLSDAIPRPFFNFQVVRWAPDSRSIIAKVLPEGMTVEQAADLVSPPPPQKSKASKPDGVTVTVYSSTPATKNAKDAPAESRVETQDWMNRYLGDVVAIDIISGKIDRIATRLKPLGYWVSPDGKYVAYMAWQGIEENTQQAVYQLYLFSFADRQSRILVPQLKEEYGISVSFSPASDSIAYMDGNDCYLLSLSGGTPQNLTPGTHPAFSHDHRAPVWDNSGSTIYLLSTETYGRPGTNIVWSVSPSNPTLKTVAEIPGYMVLEIAAPIGGGRFWSSDGNSLLLLARNEETKQAGYFKVSLPGGKVTSLFEESRYFSRDSFFTTDVSRDGKVVAYVAQDSQHPEDIWIAGPDFSNRQQLTHVNPQTEKLAFGKTRLIQWRSIDGQELKGGLLLPANYEEGKRYPLIVDVYGGSFRSSTSFRFGLSGSGVENLQLLATRGYAVLLPDTPLNKGTPMRDLLKTVMPGVDRAIDIGVADPGRLGVMGHSYGGYSTLSLIVQTTRFKAAVDSAGPADLISFYGDLDKSGAAGGIGWSETGQGGMVGSPWEFRDRYIENSPLFYLDRVETPLLIVQGDMDPIWKQADEVFVALRRLGKEAVYAKYAGEEHWEGTWSLANVKDYWARVFDWFDQHLKTEQKQQTQAGVTQ
jgi:dipeptidyl aminopeptidase/acylaminoacyl peptidase